MRAWPGWIVAALLIALAVTSAPDALDIAPSASHTQVAASEIGDKRDPQARDDGLEVRHQLAEHGGHVHLRLAALPPSAQTVAPVPVKGATQAVPRTAPATVTDTGVRPRLGACSPEALQIFRC